MLLRSILPIFVARWRFSLSSPPLLSIQRRLSNTNFSQKYIFLNSFALILLTTSQKAFVAIAKDLLVKSCQGIARLISITLLRIYCHRKKSKHLSKDVEIFTAVKVLNTLQ